MSEQIKQCPYCGIEEGKVSTTSAGKRFYVGSPCGASGPVADNESDAEIAELKAEIEKLSYESTALSFFKRLNDKIKADAITIRELEAEIEKLRKERHTMCIDYERVEQERDEAKAEIDEHRRHVATLIQREANAIAEIERQRLAHSHWYYKCHDAIAERDAVTQELNQDRNRANALERELSYRVADINRLRQQVERLQAELAEAKREIEK